MINIHNMRQVNDFEIIFIIKPLHVLPPQKTICRQHEGLMSRNYLKELKGQFSSHQNQKYSQARNYSDPWQILT